MDDALRNKIWSAFDLQVAQPVKSFSWVSSDPEWKTFFDCLWIHHFKWPLDERSDDPDSACRAVREWYFETTWNRVYDFVESVIRFLPDNRREKFERLCGAFLEQEVSAYRIVDGTVAEVTTESDITAIEEAVRETSHLPAVTAHLRSALSLMTDRSNPDYRNSIKESISAVEALCRHLVGDSKATLGKALNALEGGGVSLHPALTQGWKSLYGYSSDSHGIRHALQDKPDLVFEDAKYMHVSCSAFISYLLSLDARRT